MGQIILEKKDLGKISFGRYDGEKWSSLPIDYLEYLISDECHTSIENKQIAKEELAQRSDVPGQCAFIF